MRVMRGLTGSRDAGQSAAGFAGQVFQNAAHLDDDTGIETRRPAAFRAGGLASSILQISQPDRPGLTQVIIQLVIELFEIFNPPEAERQAGAQNLILMFGLGPPGIGELLLVITIGILLPVIALRPLLQGLGFLGGGCLVGQILLQQRVQAASAAQLKKIVQRSFCPPVCTLSRNLLARHFLFPGPLAHLAEIKRLQDIAFQAVMRFKIVRQGQQGFSRQIDPFE